MTKSIEKLVSSSDTKFSAEMIGFDINDINLITSNALFASLDVAGKNEIYKRDILDALSSRGILADDPRIQETIQKLKELKDNDPINSALFHDIIYRNITLIERALKGDLIIPDFRSFSNVVTDIFESSKGNMGGHVADYIPQLARVNPNYYALSICTVDGQRLNIGNTTIPYCVQSTCKPINYCIALEDSGEDTA